MAVPKQQTLCTFDRVEFCDGTTVVSVPHGGETISVTLAFCTSPSSATQLFSGHGGRLDIIVTVSATLLSSYGQNGLIPVTLLLTSLLLKSTYVTHVDRERQACKKLALTKIAQGQSQDKVDKKSINICMMAG